MSARQTLYQLRHGGDLASEVQVTIQNSPSSRWDRGDLAEFGKTRRERPKSAPYLRLKNIQGTTIGKIWKKIFFSKKLILIFFRKKVFFKSHNAEKLKKRPFRLIQRFLQTENFKKMQGGTL